MGNHKFRLSDMMPNAWFYKLRDMSIKSRSSTHINNNPYPTKSSYRITDTNPNNKTFFDKSPRKSSSKKKSKRKTVYMPSPKKQPQINNNPSVLFPGPGRNFPVWLKPGTILDHHQEHFPEDDESDSLDAATCNDDSCCTCKLVATTTSSDDDDDGDIIIDVSGNNRTTIDNLVNGFEDFNDLPPIRTKPAAKPALPSSENDGNAPRAKKSRKIAARKSVSRAGGVKIRANGPRVATNGSRRKLTSVKLGGDRDYDYDYEDEEKKKKGLSFYSESFAIVKASFDPEKDFRESMMEMIVENNIRASKELEHLLACYLSLNSYQYHDLIVKAFEQIWFNMPQLEIN